MLVTPEEMKASNEAPAQAIAKLPAVTDAPVIEVLTPKLSGGVSSPTPIELKFQAISPSKIKPESFKALYGSLQIDITKKLLKVAKLSESGLQVQAAELPKGRHQLLLIVEDSDGRTGRRSIEFEVN